jgi:hypothetical protein
VVAEEVLRWKRLQKFNTNAKLSHDKAPCLERSLENTHPCLKREGDVVGRTNEMLSFDIFDAEFQRDTFTRAI